MVGQTLKHYRIDGVLGKGGMGQVYSAHDTRLRREVAIKVLPAEYTTDPARKQRMIREARAAGAVNHPAIAQIYDVDEVDGVTFIAMERVEGHTLRELVERRELDLLGAVEIAIQVADGLARAHAKGIVHRDIKAANVMLTPDGHAKILDFGLAKLLETAPADGSDGTSEPHATDVETMTRTAAHAVIGTVAYMSPEQARGRGIDHRSDIFSLGILLYEMVTGELPFRGDSPLDTMHAIAYEETRPVTTIRAQLPASLQHVVTRALRKRPEDRYQDIGRLADDLRAVRREVESGVSRPVPLSMRMRDSFHSLQDLTPREWGMPLAIALAAMTFLYLSSLGEDMAPVLIMLGVTGLLFYRRIRNRQSRMLKRFCARVKKLPEVRIVVGRSDTATVVVDRSIARNLLRIHAAMDRINEKRFFGDPLNVAVRDDLPESEMRALLGSPGVLYVRDDVLGEPEA